MVMTHPCCYCNTCDAAPLFVSTWLLSQGDFQKGDRTETACCFHQLEWQQSAIYANENGKAVLHVLCIEQACTKRKGCQIDSFATHKQVHKKVFTFHWNAMICSESFKIKKISTPCQASKTHSIFVSQCPIFTARKVNERVGCAWQSAFVTVQMNRLNPWHWTCWLNSMFLKTTDDSRHKGSYVYPRAQINYSFWANSWGAFVPHLPSFFCHPSSNIQCPSAFWGQHPKLVTKLNLAHQVVHRIPRSLSRGPELLKSVRPLKWCFMYLKCWFCFIFFYLPRK